VYVDVTIL